MTLLKAEILKAIRKPYVPIAFIVLTAVNLIGVFLSNRVYQAWAPEADYNRLCVERACGPIDSELLDYVIGETNRLSLMIATETFSRDYDPDTYTGYILKDWIVFHDYISKNLKYAVGYDYVMQDVLRRAVENVDFYQRFGNERMARVNREIYRLYSNRHIPEFRNLYGIRYYLHYDFSSLIILLLLLLTLSPVFAGEKANRMNLLFPTYPDGGAALLGAKIAFVFLVTIAYSFWFYLVDLIGFSIFAHMQGFSLPLYAVQDFQFTPLRLTVFQYILLGFALKTLGMSLAALWIAAASRFLSGVFQVFIAGLIPVFLYFVGNPMPGAGLTRFDFINPILLIKNRYLFFSFDPLFFGSFLIQSAAVVVFAGVIGAGLLTFLCRADFYSRAA